MVKRMTAIGLMVLVFLVMLTAGQAYGQEQQTNYLQYQEPQPPATSIGSSIAYVLTLLATFAIVIVLAYMASRFVGQRLSTGAGSQRGRILVVISLGANRSLQVVEVAGKVLVLGVTDHTVNLLHEVTDREEIAKLNSGGQQLNQADFEQILGRQLATLQQMSRKFPGVFGGSNNSDVQQEKRNRQ